MARPLTESTSQADHTDVPASPSLSFTCPNCSAPLEGRTCKLRCTRCGYFESCSDLEPAPPASPSR